MWWKLAILAILSFALIVCVIPVRTHAALVDPARPPQPPSIWPMVAGMYVTPATIALIAAIVAIAIAVGIWIVRSA